MYSQSPLLAVGQLALRVLLIVISIEEWTQATKFVAREDLPMFLEPVVNTTVVVGREASLSCTIDNLGSHKVAWVHLDRQMIVAIHRQIVSREKRFYVTYDEHKTWTLHVTQVTEKDRGNYMCQVNSDPMISQKGYLQVVVPPNIVDGNKSVSSHNHIRENDNVTLSCESEGFPKPNIKWRREDGGSILICKGNRVHQVEGNILDLVTVSREHIGAYFCIASNGVPPAVSKRITVDVEFPPELNIPNQLVGASLHNEVKLECQIEASPQPVLYWTRNGAVITNSTRISIETSSDKYKFNMFLTINDILPYDFGQYVCVANNSLGEVKGLIRLNEMILPPKPTNPSKSFMADKYARHRGGKKLVRIFPEVDVSFGDQEPKDSHEYRKFSYENYFDDAVQTIEERLKRLNPFSSAAGCLRGSRLICVVVCALFRLL